MADQRPLTTRRDFLGRGLSLAATAATVPSFLDHSAAALDDGVRRNPDRPLLVVLQLAGGNDGLNTLVPFADDVYYRQRPTLAVPRSRVLRLTDELGLHPALTDLQAVHDAGELALVQAVGYPNPSRSHFRALEIWETAHTGEPGERSGWLGRYFDHTCAGAPAAPLGLRVGRQLPRAFAGVEAAEFLGRTALTSDPALARLLAAARHRPAVSYPDTPLAADLKLIARLIAADCPSRIYYASLGGFDTHAQQAGTHARLLAVLGGAVRAFLADLRRQGNLERVVLLAFSEFGRRVRENGSGGTDHGAGGLLLLAGGPVVPGLHGPTPSLTDLDRGDLKPGVDFRRVYATLLDDWLGADSRAILGQRHDRLPLLRAGRDRA